LSSHKNIICNPSDDNNKRFLLGKKGSNEMLAIGLNPSTANEDNLDPTSRNIQAIAQNNGCDGWWLINLYAQRTPKPSNLPKKVNQVIAKENIDVIKELIHNDNNISKILFCWGNHINDHSYLKKQADQIIATVKKLDLKPLCLGKTLTGNPLHPIPMVVNRFFGGINNVALQKY
jgi:hypothetical protein